MNIQAKLCAVPPPSMSCFQHILSTAISNFNLTPQFEVSFVKTHQNNFEDIVLKQFFWDAQTPLIKKNTKKRYWKAVLKHAHTANTGIWLLLVTLLHSSNVYKDIYYSARQNYYSTYDRETS